MEKNFGKNCAIAFDGYTRCTSSIKIAEQIVSTAIEIAIGGKKVTVVAEDVDFLTLSVARTPPCESVYYIKPSKGKVVRRIYLIGEIQAANPQLTNTYY